VVGGVPCIILFCVKLILLHARKNLQQIWVSEDKVLRRMFGPQMDNIMGGWRVHNLELHILLGGIKPRD
jgi:hypothetical protein